MRYSPTYTDALREFKRMFFLDALQATGGNQCKAADRMGVHRNTVQRLLREVGLTRADVRNALAALEQPPKKPAASVDPRKIHVRTDIHRINAA